MQRVVIALLVLALAGCASSSAKIDDGISAAELIQKGQAAYDWNRYKQAYVYYAAIIERYPDDIDRVCEAQYEIARVHYKQKKYELAREEMSALQGRYETPEGEILPQKFKILSDIVLAQIDAKQKRIVAEE